MKNPLLTYKQKNRLGWREFAKLIGVSVNTIRSLSLTHQNDILLSHAIAIKQKTNIDVWDYLPQFKGLKKILTNE